MNIWQFYVTTDKLCKLIKQSSFIDKPTDRLIDVREMNENLRFVLRKLFALKNNRGYKL